MKPIITIDIRKILERHSLVKDIERKLKQKQQEERNVEREVAIQAKAKELQSKIEVSPEAAEEYVRKKMKQHERELSTKQFLQKVGQGAKKALSALQKIPPASAKVAQNLQANRQYYKLLQQGYSSTPKYRPKKQLTSKKRYKDPLGF